MKSMPFLMAGVLILSTLSVSGQDKIDFVKQIKPILEQHCVSCHGGDDYEEFQIDIRDEALNYIEAGDSSESPIYTALIADEDEIMPPADEEDELSEDDISLIKKWIDEGAEWPDDLVLGNEPQDSEETDGGASTSSEMSVDEENGPEPGERFQHPTDNDSKNSEANNADTENAEPDKQEPKDDVDPKTQQVFNAIGSLHPAATHLPIGLLLAAGFFALFSLRGNFVMSDCAYYCLWLGTFGAIAGCATGWWFSPMEGKGTVAVIADLFDQDQKVFWHRTGAILITAAALILALIAAGARRRDPDDGVLWKIGLILLAGGIGWVGHTGGELHYPPNHYKDLNNLYEGFFDSDDADEENAKTKTDTKSTDAGDDAGDDGVDNGSVAADPNETAAPDDD